MLQKFLARLDIAESVILNDCVRLTKWFVDDELFNDEHEIVSFIWFEKGMMQRVSLTEGEIKRGRRDQSLNRFVFENDRGRRTRVQLIMPPTIVLLGLMPPLAYPNTKAYEPAGAFA